jgi:hypothetical protein
LRCSGSGCRVCCGEVGDVHDDVHSGPAGPEPEAPGLDLRGVRGSLATCGELGGGDRSFRCLPDHSSERSRLFEAGSGRLPPDGGRLEDPGRRGTSSIMNLLLGPAAARQNCPKLILRVYAGPRKRSNRHRPKPACKRDIPYHPRVAHRHRKIALSGPGPGQIHAPVIDKW